MSDYISKFVKQHTEYFLRNKKIIESNKWDSNESFDNKIKDFSTEILILRESQDEDVDKKLSEIEKNLLKFTENARKNKENLFKQENELTTSILGRLSSFIKEIERTGDRKEPAAQKFIDTTVQIIQIHIKKCKKYLDYSMDEVEEESLLEDTDFRSYEILFQDNIFSKMIEIQDNLEKLNISGEVENTSIRFYNDMKATLPMIDVLPAINADIAEMTEKLDLPTEMTDKDFFILKKQRGDKIPRWEEKKHYWEQKPEVLKFWWNEWLKINRGLEIDGYYVHPWLYYHLNFYKTPIPQPGGMPDKTTNPRLRDNEWWIAENLKKIESRVGRDRGLLLYGSRRFAKSVTMSSICDWKALTQANVNTSIKSGSAGDLAELTKKIDVSMTFMEPAFRMYKSGDWEKEIFIGIKTDANNSIAHSHHFVKNLDNGARTATQKTAGGAPSISLYEEIGKAPWEKAFRAEIPAFSGDDGWKTTLIAVGTSGEASLSGDAMMAVTNPESFKFMEMDWDLFESKLPVDFKPTWKRRTFATFVPGQMANFPTPGFKRIKRGFGDFLGIESELLNQIVIEQTDWVTNTQVILEEREALSKSSFALQQITVQYPIDPEECFLSPDKNPLPYLEAKNHKEYIQANGLTGKKVFLYRDSETGKIKSDFDESRKVALYPHSGGFIDSPVLLFEDLPEIKPPYGLYTAGFDDYKQDESDNSESVGTLYIFKRDILGVKNAGRIVASLSTRPDPHTKMHKQWHLMLEAFNVMAFGENEDMDFKKHLDHQRLAQMFLVPSMDFESEEQLKYGGVRKFGWQPTPKNKKFLFGLFRDYCNQTFTVKNEEGVEIELLGVQLINDVALLDEIINYSKDKNVDRITAMMGALGYDFYLFLNWIFPKTENVQRNIEEAKKKKEEPKNLAQRMFTTGMGNRLFK